MSPSLTTLVGLRPRSDILYVSRNQTVLATGLDGFVDAGPDHGLFVHQTRLLSRYRYLIDGEPPRPLALSNVEQHSWLGYYLAPAAGDGGDARDEPLGPGGRLAQQPIELRLTRTVGDGLHEDTDITNYARDRVAFTLELEADADFVDKDETKDERRQQGELRREWRPIGDGAWELAFDYRAEHRHDRQGDTGTARIHRSATLQVRNATTPPSYRGGRLSFQVELGRHASWHACLEIVASIEGEELPPPGGCYLLAGDGDSYETRRIEFLRTATAIETPETGTLASVVAATLERAKRDLAALRLHDLDRDDGGWVPAAGLPVYVALFGRDSLTAAWQATLTGPEMMRGTLAELARWQGRVVNDWRDEQPGRMLHQADTGPLATLGFNPLARYYGSATTSGFYPVVVSEFWHWTGDEAAVREAVGPALAATRWLDESGDLDGDGFYEYRTRSEQGVKHQAWKDSGDAIVDESGSQVEPPIATCEEQGFVYLAKLRLSEVLWWLGEKDEARRLFREAGELKKRFNEAFWMEDEGYFAVGLDSQKRPIRSITSNPGHCLATGIADEAFVPQTADRLLASDLFSGWGVRTLSTGNPAFNPYSYHLGSVWPVEQATFALGFLRYGLHGHAERLCRATFEAAALFEAYRLPELFSGHPRDDRHPFPANYPRANSPQAWSASAAFCLLQALLGLYPYAPLKALLLDPHLPEWLPEITLRNLRVGEAAADVRFFRTRAGVSDYEVLDRRGTLHVVRQPSPWSLTATFAERLRDALGSLLPGR